MNSSSHTQKKNSDHISNTFLPILPSPKNQSFVNLFSSMKQKASSSSSSKWQGKDFIVVGFLVHLNRRLKWVFLITICMLSVVVFVVVIVVGVVVNFSHFCLLPQNHWASYNQSCKTFLGDGVSSLFKWRATSFRQKT